MELINSLKVNIKKLNRQDISFVIFVCLIFTYTAILIGIRNAYGEPSIFFSNKNTENITNNLANDINSERNTDNSPKGEENFLINNITDNREAPSPTIIITIKSMTTTPKPTTKPTTKPPTSIPTTIPTTPVTDYSKPWEVSPGCPTTTQSCVPCITGEAYCRIESGKSNGFKGWACQNNNPGNIRPGSSKNTMISNNGGTPPCGERSGYMVFRTFNDGKNGLKAYLKGISNGQHSSYKNVALGIYCGECSLQFFFNIYAPAGDQNDPASYANYVASRIGVSSSNTMLSWIVANKLDAFADAIQTHEGWFTY